MVSQPDTGYTDHSGEPRYYKLRSVDVHGNESGFAVLLPTSTSEVPGTGLPAQVMLGPAQPNPVIRGAEFRFGLPREGRVSLVLFDQQGRRVRELLSGIVPVGEHSMSWDGRDHAGRLVPSGLYFCRLEAEGLTLTRRLAAIH